MTGKFPTHNGVIKSLEGVEVGDVFMLAWDRSSTRYETVKCESVTPKQCVIGGKKYRKEGARSLEKRSSDRYSRYCSPSSALMEYDQKAINDERDKAALENMRYRLRDEKWGVLDSDKVRKIIAILEDKGDAS